MDAVALGALPGGWIGLRQQLADMYTKGGYPELSKLIEDFDS
jgi:hypothetical protein